MAESWAGKFDTALATLDSIKTQTKLEEIQFEDFDIIKQSIENRK